MAALNTQKVEDVLVVYFTDSSILDESTMQSLGRDLMACVERCEDQKLLLNFESVKYMSSAMLGKLVALNKKCKEGEVTLKMCNIDKDIMLVFQMTKLHKVFDIQPNEEKAMKSFVKKGLFGFGGG